MGHSGNRYHHFLNGGGFMNPFGGNYGSMHPYGVILALSGHLITISIKN
jgi:hypothetical protein